MGAVAANLIDGIPLWLMMIGPPGCGKTELLKSLMGIPRMQESGSMTGVSSLLSGSGKRDRDKDATGGLLREIGNRGGLVINEFTSVLSIPHEPLGQLLAALRQVYDGHWIRRIGEGGGRFLEWGPGKIGGFAGCTEAIDDHHKVMSDLGERWVYYRFPASTGWQESNAAINRTSYSDMQGILQEVVGGFFAGLGLRWPDEGKGETWEGRRALTVRENGRIIAIAQMSARCRSSVVRNERREVERVGQPERPQRLAGVFTQLYLGLERVGLPEGERWATVRKVALDCMPQTRKQVLGGVVNLSGDGVDSTSGKVVPALIYPPAGINDFLRGTRCSEMSTRRGVEDLEIHGVLRKVGGGGGAGGGGKLWELGEEARVWVQEGWG